MRRIALLCCVSFLLVAGIARAESITAPAACLDTAAALELPAAEPQGPGAAEAPPLELFEPEVAPMCCGCTVGDHRACDAKCVEQGFAGGACSPCSCGQVCTCFGS